MGASLKAFVELHKGPSPGPSPPSPPIPTPPSPSPSGSAHYEQPPCRSDEIEVQVQGASGVMCSPSCTDSPCPSNIPAGVTARPECVLQDSQANRYCALVCGSDSDCDQAHGATCQALGSISLCMYSAADNGNTCPVTLYPG